MLHTGDWHGIYGMKWWKYCGTIKYSCQLVSCWHFSRCLEKVQT